MITAAPAWARDFNYIWSLASCDITIRKDDHERRHVLGSESPGHFIGEIWHGRVRRFRERLASVHDARMLAAPSIARRRRSWRRWMTTLTGLRS